MKSIKAIGLAALAALTAMAFVGVSLAMAGPTQLCKTDESSCKAVNVIEHVHEVGKAKLLTALFNPVECDVLFLGKSLGLATPLLIHGKFTYMNCKAGGQNCEVEEVSKDSLIEVLRTASELADVTAKGEVHVACGLLINCTYAGVGLKGHGLGALATTPNGETRFEEQVLLKISGTILCPPTAQLDLLTTPLEPVYIVE